MLKTGSGSLQLSISAGIRLGILEWGGDARTRDECQARGAGRAGPACPPSVRPSVR